MYRLSSVPAYLLPSQDVLRVPPDDWRDLTPMDVHLTKEKSSAYHNLVKGEDALPIYECMHDMDLSEIVLTAQRVLKDTARMPLVSKMEKSERRSNELRLAGDNEFALGRYRAALSAYNKALCHAPQNSFSLKSAYASRSSILEKLEAYGEAIADINLVLRSGCPLDLEPTLVERHRFCRAAGWIKKLDEESIPDQHSLGKFFELTSINPELNTATLDVGVVVTDDGIKKVVAAKNINPGSLVIMEPAFVSQTNDLHKYLACSFCHRLAFNLIPCNYCCDTLFCSPICKEMSNKEYHQVECRLSEVLRNTSMECRMAFRSIIHMKSLSLNWNAMIASSGALGQERSAQCSVEDDFSHACPFALLSAEIGKTFVHGTIFNLSMDCAVIMYYVAKIPSFLPKESWRKKIVLSSLCRTMMHLGLNHAFTQMPIVVGHKKEIPRPIDVCNYGWFPLISKLPNSCTPNLVALAVNKEIALIAVRPIKVGEQLTMPYLGHWLDNRMSRRNRQKTMFALTGAMCHCFICVRGLPKDPPILSKKQRDNWQRLNIESMAGPITSEKVDSIYERICKALAIFHDVQYTKEYVAIYRVFRRCLEFYQAMKYPQRLLTEE